MTNIAIEKVKLALLFTLFFLSLSTLFTSNHTNPKGIPQLNIKPTKICRIPQQKLSMSKKCSQTEKNESGSTSSDSKKEEHYSSNILQESTTNCNTLKKQLQKCQTQAAKALRHINAVGCIKEINKLSICKEECADATISSCEKECEGSLLVVNLCLKNRIKEHFSRVGLKEDGTFKLSS